ncbi:MAG TPA: EAL domain-containing protein [Candidatus Limnocylindrales bacterium]|nr:EAL domain-containing protein [Candidatus Limnocylindrales bacterium]
MPSQLILLPALPLLLGVLGLCLVAHREARSQRELVRRLRDSEGRLSVIVDTSPSAVITADETGQITGWNRQAEEIFGWRRDEALGRTLSGTIIPRRYRRAHERGLARFRDTGRGKILGKSVTMMALHRDGREFPIELAVSPTWQSASHVNFVAFVTDITERWEAERLRAAQFAVTRPLATAATWAEAAPQVIRGICDTLGWARGEFWAVDRGTRQLILEHQWHRPAQALEEFARVSASITSTRGRGLLGRAWSLGRAIAVPDVAADTDLPQASAAAAAGLRGALAFATMNGREVTGVMAFYRTDTRTPQRGTLRVLSDMGSQIGQFIERRRAEEALRRSGDRMRAVLDNVADGIITVDERSQIRTINPAAQRLFDRSVEELVGRDVTDLIAVDHRVNLRRRLHAYLAEGDRMGLGFHETVGLRRDGSTFPLEFVATRMGSQRLLIGSLRDISDRKAETEALQYQAMHDGLTGLANRTFLRERLEDVVRAAERERRPGGVLLLDLDGFKGINDSFGHAVGDLVLKDVARRIRSVLRKVDTVARLGGDEFAVVPFGATDVSRGIVIADKIIQALRVPMMLAGQAVEVTASIGIAIHPQHGEDADALLRHADVAMYAAKRARSGYCVYIEEQEAAASTRAPLIGKLGHAINQFELQAHYQPLVEVRSRRVTKVEALLRWGHPRHGLLPPDDFIPAAEQTELIKPLTAWILNEALGQLHAWQRAGLELGMSVNLSSRNLLDDELPETIQELLETWQVCPQRLTLEITERSMLAAAAEDTITKLRATGVRLSVDDFGTGYSSLAYLKRLPLDEIKIDRSFLADVVTNRDDAAIVRSTIDLAHNLGLCVVAEGVENAETWGLLAQQGCDLLQGYFVSRPLPAPELASWLREWQRLAAATAAAS